MICALTSFITFKGDPQRYPSPPKRTRMDEDTTDELDPADLVR